MEIAMFDAKKLLDQFLGSQVPGAGNSVRGTANDALDIARRNPLAAGAIAGLLLGTRTGRKLAGSAVKVGGLAAIAGLGYQAYKNYQDGKTPAAPQPAPSADSLLTAPVEPLSLPPPQSPFHPQSAANDDAFALVLVRAMIAAARADGHIDDVERGRIIGKISAAGLDQDAEAFLHSELTAPTDLDGLVAAAVSEEQKVELYTASRLAIEPDTRAERGYLDLLAGRLGLAEALIDHIDVTVDAAKV
jgi:uncharacterized membrane protein YebE (DUF533 family)